MKIDDSNKRYSMIIAGILVISILSIFVAITLGSGGYRVYTQKGTQPHCIGFQSTEYEASERNLPENKKVVSVADKCEQTHDTKPGCITIEYKEIPYELPLCITQEEINDWWILYKVCGGYLPDKKDWIRICGSIRYPVLDNYGWIVLDQDKTPEGGIILMTEMEVIQDATLPCCCYYVNISGFVLYCNQEIHLDSNHHPTGCQIVENGPGYDGDLDKLVELDIITNWEGCHLDKQEFRIILTQKNYFSGIPNSRIKI
jgi:hypothetical protein